MLHVIDGPLTRLYADAGTPVPFIRLPISTHLQVRFSERAARARPHRSKHETLEREIDRNGKKRNEQCLRDQG
jgi:hypothetical protein